MIADLLTNLIMKWLAWWYARWKMKRKPSPSIGIGQFQPAPNERISDGPRPSTGMSQFIPSTFSHLTEEELADMLHGQQSGFRSD